MKLMEKIILVAVMSFLTMPAFASMTKKTASPSPEAWEIKKQDDGYLFLLWPENPNKLILHVSETTSAGKTSDYVTVTCNGKDNRMAPNTTLTCYGNFQDTISLFVKPEDFHNGAAGTSLLTPKD